MASNHFDKFFGQNLLSKKLGLLRLLFEGGFYLRAASNTDDTVHNTCQSVYEYIFTQFEKLILSYTCIINLQWCKLADRYRFYILVGTQVRIC